MEKSFKRGDKLELVFGLCGPLGCNMDEVIDALNKELSHHGYEPILVHLSKHFTELERYIRLSYRNDTERSKIDFGNKAREITQCADLFALYAALLIKTQYRPSEEIENRAFIIKQLKRPEEAQTLEEIYGDRFILLSVIDTKERCVNRISKTFNINKNKAEELYEVDSREQNDWGQRVQDIFSMGDVFIDASDSQHVAQDTRRFVEAFFGRNNISPRKDEYGAYFAKAASLRSVDLSRQVGAAIFDQEGSIISTGCNDVAKPMGGQYWDDDDKKFRDIDLGEEANKTTIEEIIDDALHHLSHIRKIKTAINRYPDLREEIKIALKKSYIDDITEYGRMVHAEMAALMEAARKGRSVSNATMYVTTFPCHNCAKLIIASGIRRVVFIEPYPKSRTLNLFEKALTLDPKTSDRVILEHFRGISPSLYRTVFEKREKRRFGNRIHTYYQDIKAPMIKPRDAYRELETLAMQKLVDIGVANEDKRLETVA